MGTALPPPARARHRTPGEGTVAPVREPRGEDRPISREGIAVFGVGLLVLLVGTGLALDCNSTLPPGCAAASAACTPATLCPYSFPALILVSGGLVLLAVALVSILGRHPESDQTAAPPPGKA